MKVIVIGAGIAGLMAANELAKKNVAVTVLEAENRIGGRIQTFVPESFTNHIEAGAEFIHGNLQLTLRLMKKAKMGYIQSGGKMCRFRNGKMYSNFAQTKAWDEFYEAISNAKHDLSVAALLERDFSSKKYETLTAEVRSMAQGLDLADIGHLSVFSIREEWVSEEPQFRPLGGYSALLEFLHNDAASAQYQLFLREKVQAIQWRAGYAQVQTQNSLYEADAVIVTVPLPLLQSDAISFNPPIDSMNRQFAEIGFGEVIKFTLEFEYAFWEKQHPDLGFLFVEDGFTFWTQLSEHRPVLTGWLGNDYAPEYQNQSDDDLLAAAIQKLHPIFNDFAIGQLYKSGAVFRYTKDSVWGGGYSWMTMKSKRAIRQIKKGIVSTIFFAGEAFDDGGNVGTVEAALKSGRYAARKILKLKNH